METIFEIMNLSYSYPNGKEALRGISFSVKRGEVFTVLGPNGAGKSTLLKCMIGVLPPCSGKVLLIGHKVHEMSPREISRILAYLPQEQSYVFSFKVFDFVLMGRAPHCGLFSLPGEKDREKAINALRDLGIEDLSEREISELSGGELKMTLIARALCQEAKVLVLDEPEAHLDISNRFKILKEVRDLVKSSKIYAAIVTMHDPFLSFLFSDRVLLLSNGEEVAIGPPEETLTLELLSKVYRMRFERIRFGKGGEAVLPVPRLKASQSSVER